MTGDPLEGIFKDPEFRDYSDPRFLEEQFEMYKALGDKPEEIEDGTVRKLSRTD